MELLMTSRSIFRFSILVNLTATPRIISKTSTNAYKYIGKRDFSYSGPRLKIFGDESYSGGEIAVPGFLEISKMIYNDPKVILQIGRTLRGEFQLWKKEWADSLLKSKEPHLNKGDIDMLFTFEEDAGIKKFSVITDKITDHGFSTASFVRTQNETAVFSGYIDTRLPNDGKTKYSGFASILTKRLLKSFRRYDTHDFQNYTHLVLKVRGDGRTYTIILGCPSKLNVTHYDQFHYPLYTRGGPYWQIAKIPLSNFFFTKKGRILDQQEILPYNKCSRVGITLADGHDGPFKLEIEYFGLEFQPYHRSVSPYESYAGKMIADV